jgi:chitin disaccharide deacetylase
MKYLIVNADDFGASRGINRAIIELHEQGVLTSASLMITMPAAREAVKLAKTTPNLGLGLHVTLTDEDCFPIVDFNDFDRCEQEIRLQVDLFVARFGRLPTHIDSHQNVHRDTRLLPAFERIARPYGLPLREHSRVRYFPDFYGQWDGVPHHEHIGIDSLLRMLDSELGEGVTELSCHPGYMGRDFVSPYNVEREIELQTLSHPRFLEFLCARDVRLVRFDDVPALLNDRTLA